MVYRGSALAVLAAALIGCGGTNGAVGAQDGGPEDPAARADGGGYDPASTEIVGAVGETGGEQTPARDPDSGLADAGAAAPELPEPDAGDAAPGDTAVPACVPCEHDAECGPGLRCLGPEGRDEQCNPWTGEDCVNVRRCFPSCAGDDTSACEAIFGADHWCFEETDACAPYPVSRCGDTDKGCRPSSWPAWCGLFLMGAPL